MSPKCIYHSSSHRPRRFSPGLYGTTVGSSLSILSLNSVVPVCLSSCLLQSVTLVHFLTMTPSDRIRVTVMTGLGELKQISLGSKTERPFSLLQTFMCVYVCEVGLTHTQPSQLSFVLSSSSTTDSTLILDPED